jgi:TRAP-type mannitol/chloroaromatic compound transport system permease small subunit
VRRAARDIFGARMSALLRMARAVDGLNRAIGRLAAWLTLAMVLMGAWNAVARHFDRAAGGGLSSNAFVEGQWYLFSLVFLLGAPHALRAGAHVRVDVFYGRLPERGKHWIDLLGGLLFTIPFCVFALWIAWPAVAESWAIREGSPDPGGLPRWPIKAVIPAAFALLLLQGVSETVKRAALLLGRSEHETGLREPDEVRGGVGEGV